MSYKLSAGEEIRILTMQRWGTSWDAVEKLLRRYGYSGESLAACKECYDRGVKRDNMLRSVNYRND